MTHGTFIFNRIQVSGVIYPLCSKLQFLLISLESCQCAVGDGHLQNLWRNIRP